MQVKMFKIVSGEICIGNVTGEQGSPENVIAVENPLVVHFGQGPGGKLGINLFPLNPFASSKNESLNINTSHILFFIEHPQEEIVNEYNRITSGITIAKNLPKIEVPFAKQ